MHLYFVISPHVMHAVRGVEDAMFSYIWRNWRGIARNKKTCDLFHYIHNNYMTFSWTLISRSQAGRHQPVKRVD